LVVGSRSFFNCDVKIVNRVLMIEAFSFEFLNIVKA